MFFTARQLMLSLYGISVYFKYILRGLIPFCTGQGMCLQFNLVINKITNSQKTSFHVYFIIEIKA